VGAKVETETRYAITLLAPNASEILRAVRLHFWDNYQPTTLAHSCSNQLGAPSDVRFFIQPALI
jgi:hypothetical protein